VYSLGVIAYQLLSGELPYPLKDATLVEVADHIRFHRPIPLGQRSPALRGDVEAIVAHALSKDRERRYASAADLAADVRRHLADEPVSVRRLTVGYQIAKFTRRNRALAGALLALVLVLLGSAATSTWLALRARSHSERALALNDVLLDVLTSPTAQPGDGFDVTVLEVLERSDDEMHSRLEGWPELQARLGLTLGGLYRSVGAFEAAERNLVRSLSLYKEIEGENHATTLKAARVLLQVRVIHGEDPGRAEELLSWTLRQEELTGGPESSEFLQTRHLQGLYQRRVGDLPAAVATLRSVVSVGTRTQGPDSLLVQQSRNFLARALAESGRTEEARAIAEETLSLQLALLGEEHRGTLISMVTLGEILLSEDDADPNPALLERAREVLERAVAGRRPLLGERHPGTLTARVHLARTHYRQGAHAEGIAQLEQIVEELDQLYPPTQPDVREARAHLLELYRREGRASEATALGQELERTTP
jgi:tetratricopeptide (TPR) repeat protein